MKTNRKPNLVRWVVAITVLIAAAQHLLAPLPQGSPGIPGNSVEVSGRISQLAESAFDRQHNEPDLQYVARMSDLVHETTFHCYPEDFELTWIQKFIAEFVDPKLSEGILVRSQFSCGFCHQRAYLLVSILRQNGFGTDLLGLGGHVVAQVRLGERVYALDPDYGAKPVLLSSGRPSAQRINTAYADAAWDNIDVIVDAYRTRNELYSQSYIDPIYESQKFFFLFGETVAIMLCVLGLSLLLSALSRKTSLQAKKKN